MHGVICYNIVIYDSRGIFMVSLTSGLPVYTAEYLDHAPSETICFTGHRPEKIIPYRGRPSFAAITNKVVELLLDRYVTLAAENGYSRFISGLAKGVDLWAAKGVIRLRESGKDVSLIGAMPFLRHAEKLHGRNKAELAEIEVNADLLITVNPDPEIMFAKKNTPGFSSSLYSSRNTFMVDHSSAVIAFYDDDGHSWSGTGQTVRYAIRSEKPVYRFGIADVYRVIESSQGDIEIARDIISRSWDSL